MRRPIVAALLVLGIAVLAGVEVAARLSGIGDFPVYLDDPGIGYILAPGQHGVFLRRNRWEFNEYSMGAGPFRPEGRRNVLLLGDSLVLGGNPLDQPQRLGPTLERELGTPWAVWPSGAESWSASNEATYIQRVPEAVSRMEWLVWVLNDGDFQGRSVWRSDLLNPRRHPRWLGLYAFEKYVWLDRLAPRLPAWFPQPTPPDPEAVLPFDRRFPAFQEFVRELRRSRPGLHVCIVWYPEVAELAPPPGDFYPAMSARLGAFAAAEGCAFVDLARAPGWGPGDYRDILHPSAAGNAAFARILKPLLEPAP